MIHRDIFQIHIQQRLFNCQPFSSNLRLFFQFYLNMLKKGISNGQRKIVELQCIAFVESEHTIDCFGNKVQAIFIAISVQNILIF